MDHDSLVNQIQFRLTKGETEESIRQHLEKEGNSKEIINGAFAAVHLRQKVPGLTHHDAVAHLHTTKNSGLVNVLIALVLFGFPLTYALYAHKIAPTPVATSTPSSSDTATGTLETSQLIPIVFTRPKAEPITVPTSHPAAETIQNVVQTIATAITPTPSQPVAVTTPATSTPSEPTSTTTPTTPTGTTTPPVPEPPLPPTPDPGPEPSGDPDPGAPTASSTPTASTTPSTPPPVSPIPTGTYAVYQGCQSPATSFANTMYIDPANGSDTGDGSQAHPYKTLATVLTQKKLNTDTHVVLLPGDQGKILADGVYHNQNLASGTGWIWLDFRPGAYAEYLDLRSVHGWLITNATLTDPAETNRMLASFSKDSNMVIADSHFYTALDSSSWTVQQWLNADNGFSSDTSSCVAILRNVFKNIRFGVQVSTRANSTDPAQNSIKVLAEDNLIKNFSGDGMRPVGSDITFYHNGIYDEYVSAADGDGNHDDGVQGFALNGAVYSNVTIDHNWVQETTDPSRAYNADLQGISSFDGLYENLRVTNNVVLTSAYHGISWYGVHDALIDHNTVVNPNPANGHKLWIYAPVGKSGGNPVNVTVSNNIAEHVGGATTGVTFMNNSTVWGVDPKTMFVAFDPSTNNFNLSIKSGGPLDGKGVGSDLTGPIELALDTSAPTRHIAAASAPQSQAHLALVPVSRILTAAADAASPSNFFMDVWNWLVNLVASLIEKL